MPQPFRRLAVATLLLALAACDQAQQSGTPPPEREIRPAQTKNVTDWNRNGIAVGRPKVFDNRTLTLMLDGLKQNLRSLQFLDQKSVASALDNFQGYRITDSATSTSVSGPSLPGVSTTDSVATAPAQITTKNTDATGASTSVTQNDANNTSTTTNNSSTITQNPQIPTAPTLSAPITDLGTPLTYGMSAGDLLNDQVNLQYQVFNLQMIADRSLSDRLWDKGTRRQAVLGFNVSIDPPTYAKDAAAVVEITIEQPEENEGAVSLVAMMPQEKTYNAAALNAKSNAFAGSAVSTYVNVGFAGRKASKVLYLYRDNDTISYENMMRAEQKSQLQFGWVFRPVLGRRSVSPGMRQMFAVVSLPAKNSSGSGRSIARDDTPTNLKVRIRTYWKKYDQGTLTTASHSQIHGWAAFREIFGTPISLRDDYMNYAVYSNVAVESPSVTDASLQPEIESVDWTYTGAKNILVSVKGRNFFTGTSVIMGGKTYQDFSGNLQVKSEERLDILTDVDSLVRSDGAIVGRYGRSALIDGGCTNANLPSDDLIQSVDLGASLGGMREIDVTLNQPFASVKRKPASNVPQLPLVLLNDTVASEHATIAQSDNGPNAVIKLWIADDQFSGKAPRLQVIYPFGKRSTPWPLVDSKIAFALSRLSSDKPAFILRADVYPTFNAQRPDGVLPANNCWTLTVSPDKVLTLPADAKSGCAKAPEPNTT